MNKPFLASFAILCVSFSVLLIGLALDIPTVKASETIYIRSNGSVDPPTAPISSVDNVTYTFNDNISESIVVERSNITIDGAGYTVEGAGSGSGFRLYKVSNVTVKKANIKSFFYGVYLNSTFGSSVSENNVTANTYDGIRLEQSSGNTISRNNVTENGNDGIKLYYSDSNNNTISENKITGNGNDGIQLYLCLNNSISENNITANSYDGVLIRLSSNNQVYGNEITNNRYGIEVLSSYDVISENNTITGNKITGSSLSGIYLDSSSKNNMLRNTIEKNNEGIVLESSSYNTISENNITANDSYGVWLDAQARNNTISRNNITANTDIGIYVRLSSNNDVSGNEVKNNYNGIWISSSSYTDIHENTVRNNYNGIVLVLGSSNAKLYHNNFINNTQQASSTSANSWDDGLEGNYWSDYTGIDLNNDGIVDSPYTIDASNLDNFPLMGLFSSYDAQWGYNVNVISNSTVDDFEFSKSPVNITIKMHVSNMTSNQTSGFCRVQIPHALMTEPYDVTVDGAEPNYANYTIHDNNVSRWIYFSFNHSTLEIIIQGIDITPPIISILSPENKAYPTKNVSLRFTVDEVTSWIGYSLDGQANVTVGGNVTLEGLLDGAYSVVVFANDTVGNMGNSSAVPFVVDITSPNITILSPKNRTYTTTSVFLNFTVDEVTSWIGYSLNGQANVTVDGNVTLFDLPEGLHSVIVFSNDTVGNMGNSTLVYFTLDAISPNIVILSPENTTYATTSVSLTFVVDEVTSWIGYSLDGQANVTISGSTTLTELPEGLHTILVYVNDTVGNMGYSDTIYFNVDTTPPPISIVSPENRTYPSSEVPLIFTIDNSFSWIGYSLNGQANVTVGGNVTLEGLLDGAYSVVVFANDTVGNMGNSSMVYFAVDTTSPNITILSPENTTYATTSVSLTFVVDEVTSWIGYSLDGQANVTITGNTTLSELSDGSHSLIVYAKDTAGNTGASEIIYFTIETEKEEEAFPTWIIAPIAIITLVGAALLISFIKIKKTTKKVKQQPSSLFLI
jgi:parallel beta-helix repeat protein